MTRSPALLDPALELPRLASSVQRVALSRVEAAQALGVSVDFFTEHCLDEIRVVRRGRRVLIPVRELERWLDRAAELTLEAWS